MKNLSLLTLGGLAFLILIKLMKHDRKLKWVWRMNEYGMFFRENHNLSKKEREKDEWLDHFAIGPPVSCKWLDGARGPESLLKEPNPNMAVGSKTIDYYANINPPKNMRIGPEANSTDKI